MDTCAAESGSARREISLRSYLDACDASSTHSNDNQGAACTGTACSSVTDRANRTRVDESLRLVSGIHTSPCSERTSATHVPMPVVVARAVAGEHRVARASPMWACTDLLRRPRVAAPKMQQPARHYVYWSVAKSRLQEAARKRIESQNELTPELTPVRDRWGACAPIDTASAASTDTNEPRALGA